MTFFFDHLVWFLKKPEEAIFLLQQKGIHAVTGGRHESWGTYNTLSYFGLNYIEFLGIQDLSIAERHDENRLVTQIVKQLAKQGREGPAAVAIQTTHIKELAAKLQAEGLTVYGPLPGERVRADGQVIKWSLLFLEHPAENISLPFFIEWEKPDNERYAEIEKQSLAKLHAASWAKLESVGFVVYQLDKTLEIWKKLFDLKESEEYINKEINARCKTLKLNRTNVWFCTPLGEGLAAEVLKEKGETPFFVNLNDANQHHFSKLLNGYWKF